MLIIMLFGVVAILVTAIIDPRYRLMYNTSTSAPLGWYLRVPASDLGTNTLVLARLPESAAAFAAARNYLPLHVPILKPIGAKAGQKVCEKEGEVLIDGHVVARAFKHDDAGRPLPHWMGCRALEDGEFFLLSHHSAASFDSRYFGPIKRDAVIGRAIPLWTW
jgi:conjugative transfer signal peptidase TraF